jgi:hypothetical protein
MDDTSRMKREFHVRFCERLEVQFLGPTRHTDRIAYQRRDCEAHFLARAPLNATEPSAGRRVNVTLQMCAV